MFSRYRTLSELETLPFYTAGYLRLGKLYADIDRRDESLKTLNKAQEMFCGMGMVYWLRRTQDMLDRL
jgi:hypothetical protein